MDEKEFVIQSIDAKEAEFRKISQLIWAHPEIGYHEHFAVRTFTEALQKEGFTVTSHLAGIPTAIKGVWGSGSPVIGILGEYDALPGLNQKAACPRKEPIVEGAPGHGCGHNLLGTGSFAAAVAVKEYLETTKRSGTVIFFGCPAEETLGAKSFMARDHVFDGVDFFYTWHPAPFNTVPAVHMNACISRIYQFKGITAHAGGAPELGRSALDSIELMNVGANYLREHVIMEARIHYAYLDAGGEAPNVVQDHAAVRYMIRAPYLKQIHDIASRLDKVAKGASLMAGTKVKIIPETGCSEYLPNTVLGRNAERAMRDIGAPPWEKEDFELAKHFTKCFSDSAKLTEVQSIQSIYGNDRLREKLDYPLDTEVESFDISHIRHSFVSTDVGDVAFIAPTFHLTVATEALGTPAHSWIKTSQAGSKIGEKGMLTAGKILALACIRMIKQPELIAKAQKELTNRGMYDCPVSDVQ